MHAKQFPFEDRYEDTGGIDKAHAPIKQPASLVGYLHLMAHQMALQVYEAVREFHLILGQRLSYLAHHCRGQEREAIVGCPVEMKKLSRDFSLRTPKLTLNLID